jgi:hypothetical protein
VRPWGVFSLRGNPQCSYFRRKYEQALAFTHECLPCATASKYNYIFARGESSVISRVLTTLRRLAKSCKSCAPNGFLASATEPSPPLWPYQSRDQPLLPPILSQHMHEEGANLLNFLNSPIKDRSTNPTLPYPLSPHNQHPLKDGQLHV